MLTPLNVPTVRHPDEDNPDAGAGHAKDLNGAVERSESVKIWLRPNYLIRLHTGTRFPQLANFRLRDACYGFLGTAAQDKQCRGKTGDEVTHDGEYWLEETGWLLHAC